jgi:hypothetical protein
VGYDGEEVGRGRSREGERGRLEEWENGRMGEWERPPSPPVGGFGGRRVRISELFIEVIVNL